MPLIVIEIIIVVILTIFNGLLAMAEISIVSSRRARLHQLADDGNRNALTALRLVESPGDFLSTVQVGITLIGILTGAFGGITVAEQLGDYFSTNPLLAPYAEPIGIAVVVLATSYLSLILGELVPKRIALSNPEQIGSLIAGPMRFLSRLASPVVRFLSMSTNAILWLLRVRPSMGQPITEEEVRILIDEGTMSGVFKKGEQEMIDAVFRLANRRVNAMMTTRKDIIAFETTDSLKTIQQKIIKSSHSHYPLCEGDLDNILGVVSIKDLLLQSMAGTGLHLQSIVREMPSIPESSSALAALETLKKSRKPLGIVADEFGRLVGIVTVDDFVGAIVGVLREIPKPTVTQRSDGSWLIDGLLPFDDFREKFPSFKIEDQPQSYVTVAGFVLSRIGSIPISGDSFEYSDFRIEVVDMDGLRVDKILMTPRVQ